MQQLDRDATLELRVVPFIDPAHAAHAELAAQPVATGTFAGPFLGHRALLRRGEGGLARRGLDDGIERERRALLRASFVGLHDRRTISQLSGRLPRQETPAVSSPFAQLL